MIPVPKSFTEFRMEEIEGSIPGRFEKQALIDPMRLAVKFGSHKLTYGDLNEAANRIAQTILELRGEAAEPVAFLLEGGHQQVVAIMGILKAGKIYVPLDPSFPRARLEYMLDDSQASLILTNNRNCYLAEDLAQNRGQILNIDQITAGPCNNPGLSIPPEAISNILYTSGSTGEPKGVTQNHRNVLHAIRSVTNSYTICMDDRLALLFSSSFAAAMTPTFAALLNGATLLPFDLKRDLHQLAAWLDEEQITVYISVATLFRHMATHLERRKGFPHLRHIIIGGETVLRRDVELFKEFFSDDCTLHVRLAGTEMHRVRSYPIDKNTLITESLVPVGFEVEGKKVSILDEDGNELGFNLVGEIAVKSRYISPGYWRKPEQTRAVFLPDPEGGDERIYLTGDLGRLRPDGCLEHLGRKGSQVKVRGHRVEIGEIEMALLDQPGIKETTVVAREITPGEVQLIAYVVLVGRSTLTIRDLRMVLSKTLPGFMIPSRFVRLDELPLTATGKVDRNTLPPPEEGDYWKDRVYLAPRDAVERQLVEIWEGVLGTKPIGVQDDFFELGGNSILAARLFAEVEEVFGKKYPLDTLLQAPTIEQGARLLRQGDERVSDLSSVMDLATQDEPEMAWDALVPIQQVVPESDRPVLFLVHVLGGHLLRYTELIRLLGQDQPVYGFQSRGLVDGMEAQDDIQEMAADYIQAMKRVRSLGPYTLGGFCFGGVVAYEMSRQLEQAGESVTFLGIFEGAAPLRGDQKRSLWRDPGAALFFARNLLYWSWSTLQLGPVRMTENLVSSVKRRVKMVLRKLGLMERSESGGLRDLPPHETEQGRKVLAAHMSAMRHYQPGEYNGPLALFRIRAQPPLRYTNSKLGWDQVARDIDVHIFATAHETLLEQPHVQQVVEELKRYLDSAQF